MGDSKLSYLRWSPPQRINGGLASPFPDVYQTRIRAVSAGPQSINVAASTPTNYTRINLNWPFDPTFDIGGWSSKGWADLAKIYRYGIVTRAWIKAQIITDGLIQNAALYGFILPVQSTAFPGDTVGYALMRDTYRKAKFTPFQTGKYGGTAVTKTLTYTWVPEHFWPARNPMEDPNNWFDFLLQSTPPVTRALGCIGVTRDIGAYSTTAALACSVQWDIYYDIICVREVASMRSADADKFITWTDGLTTEGWGEADDDTAPDADVRTDTATGTLGDDIPAAWGTDD